MSKKCITGNEEIIEKKKMSILHRNDGFSSCVSKNCVEKDVISSRDFDKTKLFKKEKNISDKDIMRY